MTKYGYFILGFAFLFLGCNALYKPKTGNQTEASYLLKQRYKQLLKYPIDSLSFPRSMSTVSGLIHKVPSKDWTSGFFVGNLCQLYQLTGNTEYQEQAEKWNTFIEKEKFSLVRQTLMI